MFKIIQKEEVDSEGKSIHTGLLFGFKGEEELIARHKFDLGFDLLSTDIDVDEIKQRCKKEIVGFVVAKLNKLIEDE